MDTEQLVENEIVHPEVEGNIQDNSAVSRKLRITVEPVICGIFLAQCLSESVLTELFLKRTCEVQLSLSQSFCDELGKNTSMGHEAENIVQPVTSVWLMWKLVLQSIVPAILSVFLGPWSDKHGRKPVMLYSVAGCSLMYAFYIILAYIPNLHPVYLLIGIIPLSCLGGYVNLITAAYCYISDVSTVQTRALRLGILEGFIFAGMLVGLPISSYLFNAGQVYKYGFLVVFGTSGVLCFLSLLYTMFFVEESVNVVNVSDGSGKLLDWYLPLEMARTCIRPRAGGRRTTLLLCILSLAFCIVVMEGESQIIFLYTRFNFGWGLYDYTIYSSINKIIIIFGCILGCWLLPTYLKVSDTYMAMLAFSTTILQNLLIAFATSTQSYFLYIGAVVALLLGAVGPSVRSILSKTVDANDLGKVFALTSSAEAIIPIVTSPLYVLVYNSSLDVLPGAVFLFSAAIYTISLIFMGVIAVIQRKQLNIETSASATAQ